MASREASEKALPDRGKQLPLLLLIQPPRLCASTWPEAHPIQLHPHNHRLQGDCRDLSTGRSSRRVKKQRQDKEEGAELHC